MVHVRLNEKETNPNPHVNFITALSIGDAPAEEESRQMLRALAAQLKPVMKAHGFVVNSFEEYEYNKVFAGRNWNNGEVVEIVLRGASGSYLPSSWLMGTLCHELAHIKHMNHGPTFQALWAQLRREVRELQSRGYYGDGYWSSGSRLADSAIIGGAGLEAGEVPEYMCGGAQTRKRPTSLRRRRRQGQAGPSNHTGAQTSKKRKAGTRVTAQGTFKGEGIALNADVSDEDQKKTGTGFRKKATSKRAREERALAVERRLQSLLKKPESSAASAQHVLESDEEEDSDLPNPHETDQERRQTMLDMTSQTDLDNLKTSISAFTDDFVLPSHNLKNASPPSTKAGPSSSRTTSSKVAPLHPTPSAFPDVIEIPDSDDEKMPSSCDVQSLPKASSTAAASASSSTLDSTATSKKSDKSRSSYDQIHPDEALSRPKKKQKISYGSIVCDEVALRKKEALGMIGGGRTLSGSSSTEDRASSSSSLLRSIPRGERHESKVQSVDEPGEWTCLVCTLSNAPGHLACSVCATPKGEDSWQRQP